MNPISLALVDDHQIVLDGLLSLLKDQADIKVVFATTKPETVVERLAAERAQVVVLDMVMPVCAGPQLARDILNRFPGTRILILSMNGEGYEVDSLINEVEIAGYALKNIGKEELVGAIKKIAAGGTYFSDEVLQELERTAAKKQKVRDAHLTLREVEIVRLIEKEYSNRQIAEALFISERTVETHRKNIFRKTNTSSIVGLIKYAYDQRLIAGQAS